MKVTIPKERLLHALHKLQNVLPSDLIVSLTSNVHIRTDNTKVHLTVTDLHMTIEATIPATVHEEGALLLPAKHLFALCKEISAQELTLTGNPPGLLLLRSGASQFRLLTSLADGFPLIQLSQSTTLFSCTSTALKEMFMKTVFAVSRDEKRASFMNLCLQKEGCTITVTGTDGKRLARVIINTSSTEPWEGILLIPLKIAQEIAQFLDNGQDTVTVALDNDRLILFTEGFVMQSSLFMGGYPDVNKIIPERTSHPIYLHREELISLLKQISLFTTQRAPSVRFSFLPGELQLSTTTADKGEGNVTMPVNFQGDAIHIRLNPHFFLDILRHIKTETVHMELKDSFTPGLILVEPTQDAAAALFVLMPMRSDI